MDIVEKGIKSNNSNNPRTVVCRLKKYKENELVLRNRKKLKGSKIFINEIFALKRCSFESSYGNR